MLTAFDLCLEACGDILTLAWAAIDFVVDRVTGFVLLPAPRDVSPLRDSRCLHRLLPHRW